MFLQTHVKILVALMIVRSKMVKQFVLVQQIWFLELMQRLAKVRNNVMIMIVRNSFR
jgi:hypothetical protein